MEIAELIEVTSRGEDTRHQFKEDFTNADGLAAEMAAFCNTQGGRIFIGVRNDGTVVGLDKASVDRLNQLISNAASNNLRPPCNPTTEIVSHPNGLVLVATLPEGISKPYMDRQGVAWVKIGSDKRRITAREDLQRLFQQSGLVHADAVPVSGAGVGDLDRDYFDAFYQREFGESAQTAGFALPTLLSNMNLMADGSLNLAGTLLFSERPQYLKPSFIVKAVAYAGTAIEDEQYVDSRDIGGKLADVLQQTVGFLLTNTRAVQGEQGFNSTGHPEVPRIVWEELVANALVHRDYFVSAPVRVLVFADRVEIISPGHLPNNLTVENIKQGNANHRNPILASFAAKLLPYRGLGSGILRVLREHPDTELIDDRGGNMFKVIVKRQPPVAVSVEVKE